MTGEIRQDFIQICYHLNMTKACSMSTKPENTINKLRRK